MQSGSRPRGAQDLYEIDLVFKALAHPARRHILQVLHARDGTMTAGDLASRFSHSWPTTTRHLGVLCEAGLIDVDRQGRERHYVFSRLHLVTIGDLWLASIGLHLRDDASSNSISQRQSAYRKHDQDSGASP